MKSRVIAKLLRYCNFEFRNYTKCNCFNLQYYKGMIVIF